MALPSKRNRSSSESPTEELSLWNSVPAPAPALHDTVAETTRPGYVDGARVLRLPKVIVYTA